LTWDFFLKKKNKPPQKQTRSSLYCKGNTALHSRQQAGFSSGLNTPLQESRFTALLCYGVNADQLTVKLNCSL